MEFRHVELWTKHTDEDSKFKLWFKHFSPDNRAFLWNSLEVSLHYFKIVSQSAIATNELSNIA